MRSSAAEDLLLPDVCFDAAEAPPGERLEHWRATVSPAVDVSVGFDRLPQDWSVRTTGWSVGGTLIVVGSYGSQTLTRGRKPIRADHLDHYALHLNQAPQPFRVEVDDRSAEVGPAQLLLTDFGRPRTLRCGDGDVLSMFIPRESLDTLLPRSLDLHGVVPTGACSAILSAHLQSLATLLPRMTRTEAPGAMRAIVQLLAASLAPSADMLALARPSLEDALHRQIKQFMEEHLAEEDLGADRICAHFRISRSTLYRLFEPVGGVVSYLKDRRLIRIHDLLASPAQRRYVGRVAEDHGFRSATHFSRAFREKFGYSPREAGAGRTCMPAGASTSASLGRWLASMLAPASPRRPPSRAAMH